MEKMSNCQHDCGTDNSQAFMPVHTKTIFITKNFFSQILSSQTRRVAYTQVQLIRQCLPNVVVIFSFF